MKDSIRYADYLRTIGAGRREIPLRELTAAPVRDADGRWRAAPYQAAKLQRDEVVAVLNQDPPENSCRPAVDPLFRSVVALYGARTLAVILTGMGQDGLRGCQHVRDAGGHILAQDEASSVVWGMPGFVVRGGLADKVVPLPEMAAEISRRVSGPSTVASSGPAVTFRDVRRTEAV